MWLKSFKMLFLLILTNCLVLNLAQDINIAQNEELYTRDFYSVPTTVKTYENDTVLLPCDYKCKCFEKKVIKK